MRRFSNIDNTFVLKNKLTLQEGYLIEWMIGLPSWASSIIIENKVFFFAAKTKACEDIPLLTEKIDTMYRYYKRLQEKGFIIIRKVDGKDYVNFTDKCKLWNSSNYSDKNPNELGQTSEKNSDKNPTYSNTNNNSNIKNSKKDSLFSIEPISIQILNHLNEKKPSKILFKPTRSNLKDIESRIKEKYKMEDFIAVIDLKVDEWKDSEKMKQYIRPSTMFGEKFGSYLDQTTNTSNDGSNNFQINQGEKAQVL